ncbi:hypothetical protein PF005_g25717 [Phytophthora fragariae]|uniref:Uncharacterized protein n=1 Tax=Phytophthora fragariae TaxID=53985 RepID=A0A6A3WHF3_9STRA|nr:hypothetical protein PF003_g35066 [Phytophthora fragariae]KAE8923378.1 hypothetical protein PF009_g26373 [Phytophthora fragariae]KAE8976294.1 hypothetical protein PF011_g24110 [Phytophthora fragariae]KAE9073664.1 hypothetical protein PF007_g25721 [Phytophthora fragariae]KAE9075793.1 hypothetical protein PF010_g24162 [Phytophthora fragariae]
MYNEPKDCEYLDQATLEATNTPTLGGYSARMRL